jgi:hypothetical protein
MNLWYLCGTEPGTPEQNKLAFDQAEKEVSEIP